MAAAVYLHNALFGQPTNDLNSDDDDESSEEEVMTHDNLDNHDHNLGGRPLPRSAADAYAHSLADEAHSSENHTAVSAAEHAELHSRTISVSSQSTLVISPPSIPALPYSPQQQQQGGRRGRYLVPASSTYTSPPPRTQTQTHQLERTRYPPTRTSSSDVNSNYDPNPNIGSPTQAPHVHGAHRANSANAPEPEQGGGESALPPPGIPIDAPILGRRPATPYPFPTRRHRHHTTTHTHGEGDINEMESPAPNDISPFFFWRKRRRRNLKPAETNTNTVTNTNTTTTTHHQQQQQQGQPGQQQGLGLGLGRPILQVKRRHWMTWCLKLLLSLVLVGWAAYTTARYWLAYLEFRPLDPSATPDPNPHVDSARSRYAFALAIASTIAIGTVVLDLSWFAYFTLQPPIRGINRVPTIGRSTLSTVNPNPGTSGRPSFIRDSVLSTGSQKSRRLSKIRPISIASLPPIPHLAAAEEQPTSDSQTTDLNTSSGAPGAEARPSTSRPISQAVSAEGGPPKVERHSKSLYTLHLPSLCHEPPISPSPNMMSRRPRLRRRKFYRTRIFLHVLHWLTFVALNICAFVNVGLTPVWFDPEPTPFSPGESNENTGVNSPHRLAGLCTFSPDVTWGGRAMPPAYPPPCAHTVSYKAWLGGAIGRALGTLLICGLWIILDGRWWGNCVSGTHTVSWRRSLKPRLPPSRAAGDSTDDTDTKENAFVRRVRLLSAASKASGRSGHSRRSAKEKTPELPSRPEERPNLPESLTATAAMGIRVPGAVSELASPPTQTSEAASGVILSPSQSRYRVRRKPVKSGSPGSSPHSSMTIGSPPLSYEGGILAGFDQPKGGKTRPNTSGSGTTVVGSPPGPAYFPASPPFSPSSPPMGRRSIALEVVPELDATTSGAVNADEDSPEVPRYDERPQSRLGRYDDSGIFGAQYRDRNTATPSPTLTYPPSSSSQPSWGTDPNMAFSPITSPDMDSPLLGRQVTDRSRGYFMVGDGGFLHGNRNEGAYDEDSYYRAMNVDLSRNTSPLSDRSTSPTSFGHGHLAAPDLRVETPSVDGDDEDDEQDEDRTMTFPPQLYPPRPHASMPYQHPLAQGIQIAMGRPLETFEREVRVLGSVVRRMSTIESFGSHERELSRRGSAGTARTSQTGRGNSSGSAVPPRENTGGSSNSGAALAGNGNGNGNGNGGGGGNGSGSGGQMPRSPEGESIGRITRAASPVEITNPTDPNTTRSSSRASERANPM